MNVDLDRIIELAKRATPGPWEANGTGAYVAMMSITNDRIEKYVSAPQAGMCMSDPDIHYIAAMSPDVAIALVEELKRLRAKQPSWLTEERIAEQNRKVAADLELDRKIKL